MAEQTIPQKLVKNADINALFQEIHSEALQKNYDAERHWLKIKEEYLTLNTQLAVLPEKLSHEVMVPIGNKALMRGSMVHTNEILVCLGDGWFVKRSAKQASEICGRRIKVCEDMLAAVEGERHLLSSRQDLPAQQDAFSADEIVEPYDEQREAQWRVKHREKEKEYRKKLAEDQKKSGNDDNDDMWKRLEELELQEELEDELNRLHNEASREGDDISEEEEEEEEDDDDDEDDLTDELSDEFDMAVPVDSEDIGVRGGNGLIRRMVEVVADRDRSSQISEQVINESASNDLNDQSPSNAPENNVRRVSFAGLSGQAPREKSDSDSSEEATSRIEFKHSPCEGPKATESSHSIETPADIYLQFKNQCKPPLKSILKRTVSDNRYELEDEVTDHASLPLAFGDVLEHHPEESIPPEEPEPPRVRPMSKFREARQRSKR